MALAQRWLAKAKFARTCTERRLRHDIGKPDLDTAAQWFADLRDRL